MVTLTASQITFDGDTAYVVTEGGYCIQLGHTCLGECPPIWMTAKCERCGGWRPTGWCLNCIYGKPIHTVEVECPVCEGSTGYKVEIYSGEYAWHGPGSCRNCAGSGTVSYQLAVREVQDLGNGQFRAICEVMQ